jgi:hypothetical protein
MLISKFESVENVTNEVFYNCVLKFNFASISGLGGLILSKKVKILASFHSQCAVIFLCPVQFKIG